MLTKPLPRRLSLAAALLALALLVTAALAQEPVKGPPAWDAGTVETHEGLVISLSPQSHSGIPEMVVFRLSNPRETLTVLVGPNWFVEAQGFKIAALDRVEVTGSRIMLDGNPTILAAQMKKGGRVLKVRDDKGTPLWGGQPPTKR